MIDLDMSRRKHIKRSLYIGFRAPPEYLDELEAMVDGGKYDGVSEAVRETSKVGIQLLHYQTMMEDPDKAAEFQAKMREIIANDEVVDWFKTLTTEQLRGFVELANLEKQNRIKVQHLV